VSGVKRYVPIHNYDRYSGQSSAEMVDGRDSVQKTQYVLSTDYDALLSERDRLREALAELVRFLEPYEADGSLYIPGLATLNRYRMVLNAKALTGDAK
jgi:hypothetical protein